MHRRPSDDLRRAERKLRDLIQRALYVASGEPLGTDASGCGRLGFALWRRFRTRTTTN